MQSKMTYDIVNAGPRNRFCVNGRIVHNSGAGPQFQNFPNSGPNVRCCEGCKRHFGAHLTMCPWCGTSEAFSDGVEWGPGPANDAIETMRTRSLDWIEFIWGDAFPVIAGSLRGMIVASPGHDLVCSDYNAIEAVGLAMLAGEQWRIDVFETHGKIYEMSASKITGTPFEEYLEYKKRTGQHHPDRKKLGKVAELACFAAGTLVFTNRGYVPIEAITVDDMLWDGEQWWASDGAVSKGARRTIGFDGIAVTETHPVYVGEGQWASVYGLCQSYELRDRAYQASRRPEDRRHYGGVETHHEWREEGAVEPVFDILNAGPRNRFTILTERGHLIVHNSGYQGWIGAWKAFGADAFFTDDQIKDNVLAWREASPMIVKLWEGLEKCAHFAVSNPGSRHTYRDTTWFAHGDALYCQLPSGRHLVYHRPVLEPSDRGNGLSLSFEGWNTNPKNGPIGWIRKRTWGGKLTENVVQAVCNDLLREATIRLEAAGYPVIMHVHDELICDVPEGFGSVEEMEAIMMARPSWAQNWPIKASGGWRGPRYGK